LAEEDEDYCSGPDKGSQEARGGKGKEDPLPAAKMKSDSNLDHVSYSCGRLYVINCDLL
jgi:hypothetical protein